MAKLKYWDGSNWVTVGGGDLTSYHNTVVIGSDLSTVPIGIAEFDKTTDTLLVFKNTVFLEVTDYTIGFEAITKNSGVWSKDTSFTFIVMKNIVDNLPMTLFSGSLIKDGTVATAKLSFELQNRLDGYDSHHSHTAVDGAHGLSPERVRKITFGTEEPTTLLSGEIFFLYE